MGITVEGDTVLAVDFNTRRFTYSTLLTRRSASVVKVSVSFG